MLRGAPPLRAALIVLVAVQMGLNAIGAYGGPMLRPSCHRADGRGVGAAITDIPHILFELDIAIKNKDEAKFGEYYGHLTEACNACHQAALQTPVVIQDPKESMFPDQDFRPKQ